MKGTYASVQGIRVMLAAVLVLGFMPLPAFAENEMVAESLSDSGILAQTLCQQVQYHVRVAQIENEPGEYVSDEMIVVYEEGQNIDSQVRSLQNQQDGVKIEVEAEDLVGGLGAEIKATIPEGASLAESIATVEQQPGVAYAQPNYIYRPMALDVQEITNPESNDMLFSGSGRVSVNDPFAAISADNRNTENQWWLYSVNAFEAWDMSQVEGKVSVAVLDTGINFDHPDLTNVIDREHAYDACAQRQLTTNPISEDYAHGSHVAGIVAGEANNGIGIAGVSYNATIIPINVFFERNSGVATDDIYLLRAYQYLLSQDIENLHVINMSLGGYGARDAALEDVIEQAAKKNIITVAAGGNGDKYGNPRTDNSWPSDYDAVVSVVCLQSNDERASWSDYNDKKDLAAPGNQVWSTWWTGERYYCASGASMAAPVVAGVAALLYAYNPELTVEECKRLLYESAIDLGEPGRDSYYGYGKVNPVGALEMLSPIRIVAKSFTMARTTTQKLAVNVLNQSIEPSGMWDWSTNDKNIATIEDDGTLTAISPGKVTISVIDPNNPQLVGQRSIVISDIQLSGSLQVSPSSDDTDGIQLAWSAAEAAKGYRIFRSEKKGGSTVALATVSDDAISNSYRYLDKTAVSGVEYWYKVQPYGQYADSTINGLTSEELRGYFVNLQTLSLLINQVRTDRAQTAVSADGLDISSAKQWVSQRTDDLLANALTKATNVSRDAQASIADYTAMETNLRTVWNNYKSSKQIGRRAVDKSALTSTIGAAELARDNAVVSRNGSDVFQQDSWVSESVYYTLLTAISTAQATVNDTSVTQQAVDDANGVLCKEIEKFEHAKQKGTRTYNRNALFTTLQKAQELRTSSTVSEDGTNVSVNDVWITRKTLDALVVAISKAQTVYSDSSVVQSDIDDAVNKLQTAIDNYTVSLMKGLKRTSIGSVLFAKIAAYIYTGSAIKPTPALTLSGKSLKRNVDYQLTYKNNVKAGTATITVTGIGSYQDTKSVNFTISKAKISACKVAKVAKQKYTGKAIKPKLSVTFKGKKLKAGTDYKISYKNNKKKGTAVITIKGKGSFTGTKSVKFKIVK